MTTPPLTPDTLKLVTGPGPVGLFCADVRCRCRDDDGEMRIRALDGAVTLATVRMAVEAHIAQWADAKDGAGA
jgi:hypothetical protein